MASGNKAGLGWVVLAAALAVPGFLFYNWWSHNKAEQARSLTSKARGRLPEGAVFQTPPAGSKPVNPVAASSAPVAATPPAVAVTTPPAAAAATPPVAIVAASTVAAIVLSRDPMLSPMDVVLVREAAEAKDRARRELEEAHRLKSIKRAPRKYVEPPIENKIELQGTVDTPDGASLVMVNNATMSLGDSFAVDGYSAKVRIVKISAAGVTFEYKKRRFTKRVNQE